MTTTMLMLSTIAAVDVWAVASPVSVVRSRVAVRERRRLLASVALLRRRLLSMSVIRRVEQDTSGGKQNKTMFSSV
jgi:hypothetical protein